MDYLVMMIFFGFLEAIILFILILQISSRTKRTNEILEKILNIKILENKDTDKGRLPPPLKSVQNSTVVSTKRNRPRPMKKITTNIG
jgi:hypothetical protein